MENYIKFIAIIIPNKLNNNTINSLNLVGISIRFHCDIQILQLNFNRIRISLKFKMPLDFSLGF